MLPFLVVGPLMKALTSMTKSTGSLAEGASKAATEVASDGIKDAVLKNVSDSTPGDEEGGGGGKETAEDTSEMFGGLDLANVKSALDDTGPMGPPEQVKGGVYKQIFEVNKLMLGSLQRMENTMKMLLAIEFERVQGMQQTDSKELIDDQEKPPKKGAGKSGLLGRAARGVGGMLGGAYGKTKGALGGNFGKLLGFGAIVLLFKKFETEIKEATADILKYFKGLYDVFKEDGIGAVFTQIGDDMKNVFYPKLKSLVGNMMNMIVTAVKEMIFGASGAKRIGQEVKESKATKQTLATLSNKLTKAGVDTADVRISDQGRLPSYLTVVSGDSALTSDDQDQLKMSIKERLAQMHEISKQAKGRVQWTTFPNADFGNSLFDFSLKNLDEYFKNYSLKQILEANPVIDGVPMNNWDALPNVSDESAGITLGDSPARKEKMLGLLEGMTDAYQEGDMSELANLKKQYQDMDPVEFKDYSTGNSTIEPIGQAYGKEGFVVTGRTMGVGTFNQATKTFINNSKTNNTKADTSLTVPLGTVETNHTAINLNLSGAIR